MGLFNQFNPCICCQAEVGVYILSSFQLFYITGALVLGGALGFTTVPLLSKPNSEEPFYRKALLLYILIGYIMYCLIEVGFYEHLHKSLNLANDIKLKRCHRWVICKLILFVFGLPIVFIHLFIDLSAFKIVLYGFAIIYQTYYIWVVQHYTVEIQNEIKLINSKNEYGKKHGEVHSKQCVTTV